MTSSIDAPMIHAAGGSGPPALLIHGFGSDRMSWVANQTEIATVATVRTLDLPGHGATPLGTATRADQMAAVVADALDRDAGGPVHIVAHSLGGAVAIVLASTRPDLVRSLALIAPVGLGAPVNPAFLTDYPAAETPDAVDAVLKTLVSRPRLINRLLVDRVLEQLAAPGVRAGLSAVAADLAEVMALVAPHAAAVAASDLPRLVIWGEADPIVPLDRDRLARFGGEHLLLPGVAHLPHVEAIRDVNTALARFLATAGQR